MAGPAPGPGALQGPAGPADTPRGRAAPALRPVDHAGIPADNFARPGDHPGASAEPLRDGRPHSASCSRGRNSGKGWARPTGRPYPPDRRESLRGTREPLADRAAHPARQAPAAPDCPRDGFRAGRDSLGEWVLPARGQARAPRGQAGRAHAGSGGPARLDRRGPPAAGLGAVRAALASSHRPGRPSLTHCSVSRIPSR